MLEKGKGPILGKFHTIQLIKSDLQLMMRIFINKCARFKIENDARFSKENYGLQPRCSMENVILKKRLVHGNSLLRGDMTIHNLADLQSYYNCQISPMGSIL